jgi:ferrous iron transport protein A
MEEAVLSKAHLGKRGVITKVKSGFLAAKMADLGLFEGNEIEVIFKAPLGDPLAVAVSGTVVSLRLEEAEWITIAS